MSFTKRVGILVLTIASLVLFQNCGSDVDLAEYSESSLAVPPGVVPQPIPAEAPPVITNKTPNMAVSVGSNIGLAVSATGTNLVYQWYKDGALLAGANTSLYSIANAAAGHAGNYAISVSNSLGSVNESIAITVNPVAVVDTSPPSITVSPADVKITFSRAGPFPRTFSMAVGTAKATSYQWYFQKRDTVGFVALLNATTPTYTIASFLFDNLGIYRLVATNQYGSVSDDTLVYY